MDWKSTNQMPNATSIGNTIPDRQAMKIHTSLSNHQKFIRYFGTARSGSGVTKQTFRYNSPDQCFMRFVKAMKGNAVKDVIPDC